MKKKNNDFYPATTEPTVQGINPWLINEQGLDEFSLALKGEIKTCKKCRRSTTIQFLDKNQLCPDCR